MADDENPPAVPAADTPNVGGIESALAPIPPSDIVNSGNASAISLISGRFAPVARTDTNISHPPLSRSARESAAQVVARDVPPLLLPLLPPIENNNQQDDMSVENVNDLENYNGSLEMLTEERDADSFHSTNEEMMCEDAAPEDAAPEKKKRGRIKFKDQGVLAPCSIYMRTDADKELQTAHRVGNHVMKGVILEIPSKNNNMSYKVLWDVMGCSIPVQHSDLRTTFFKTDEMFDIMKKARVLYNESHPDPPTFHSKKPAANSNKKSSSTPKSKKKKGRKKRARSRSLPKVERVELELVSE